MGLPFLYYNKYSNSKQTTLRKQINLKRETMTQLWQRLLPDTYSISFCEVRQSVNHVQK